MNKTANQNERISCMLDGELSAAQVVEILAELKGNDAAQIRATWEQYHVLGDALRSDDLNINLSADFSKKMAAALDHEALIFNPLVQKAQQENQANKVKRSVWNSPYFAMSSFAAAAMLALIMTPSILTALRTPGQNPNGPAMASKQGGASENFASTNLKLTSNKAPAANEDFAVNTKHDAANNVNEVLRDPRLDSYLLAHQKASPSLENNGHFIQHANVAPTPEVEK